MDMGNRVVKTWEGGGRGVWRRGVKGKKMGDIYNAVNNKK